MRNPVKYLIIMAAMFCTVAAKAQNMEKLFGEMPDSIVPVMSKTNRLDCIDFFKSIWLPQRKQRSLSTT